MLMLLLETVCVMLLLLETEAVDDVDVAAGDCARDVAAAGD